MQSAGAQRSFEHSMSGDISDKIAAPNGGSRVQ